MFLNINVIIILFIINIILNIIIIYKLYHINITINISDNKSDIIIDKKLYDTIQPIENLTAEKTKEDIKINRIDFSTKKEVYLYKNKNI